MAIATQSKPIVCDTPDCSVDHKIDPLPTSVHPIEISVQHPLQFSYREHLISACRSEFDATKRVYDDLDDIDKTHRWLALAGCRLNAWFAVKKLDLTVQVVTDSCRLRWCPLCSRVRSIFLSQNLELWVRKHPHPKLLTLTLKGSDEKLDIQIIRLYACFREFRRRKFWKALVRGGIWFFQIKKSAKSGLWHPHLHILLDSEFLPHALLKSTWHDVTGDSDIVDIRVIHKPEVAAKYVSRYSARPANLADYNRRDSLELVRALHGRRLCGKFGSAGTVDLSGKSHSEKGELFSVISWSTARDNVTTCKNVRLLWKHFKPGEPLPPSFDYENVWRTFKGCFDQYTDPNPRSPPDPFLFPINPVVFPATLRIPSGTSI